MRKGCVTVECVKQRAPTEANGKRPGVSEAEGLILLPSPLPNLPKKQEKRRFSAVLEVTMRHWITSFRLLTESL